MALIRYWKHVSPVTAAPRCCAASISAAAAAQVTWTTNRGAPTCSAMRGSASGSLRLDVLGPGQRVVDRRDVAARERALDQQVDDVAVLGVHHRQRIEVSGALHAGGELVVANHQRTLVGHEQLERANARLRHRGHVLEDRLAGVGDRHVKAVVHMRGSVGATAPLVERGLEIVGMLLDREIDEARHSAGSRRLRAGVVVVGRHRSHERHRQVRVIVDQAWQHEAARRIHDVGSLGSDDTTDGGDLLPVDQDVAVELAIGGDDRSVGDQGGLGHGSLPVVRRLVSPCAPRG